MKNVLVIGAVGQLLRVSELKDVPEDEAIEAAKRHCAANGLQYKTCIRCDMVSYDVLAVTPLTGAKK